MWMLLIVNNLSNHDIWRTHSKLGIILATIIELEPFLNIMGAVLQMQNIEQVKVPGSFLEQYEYPL